MRPTPTLWGFVLVALGVLLLLLRESMWGLAIGAVGIYLIGSDRRKPPSEHKESSPQQRSTSQPQERGGP